MNELKTILEPSPEKPTGASPRKAALDVQEFPDRKTLEEELQQQARQLSERVKELNCLYGISKLMEKPASSENEILQGTVELLPPAWQHPALACARITLKGKVFTSGHFQYSPWRLSGPIRVHEETAGQVDVFYIKKPSADEADLFLPEETKLIEVVAERIGRLCERIQAEQALAESESKFRTLFESANDGIFIMDREYILDCNSKTLEMFGCTKEQIIGQPPYRFSPDFQPDGRKSLEKAQEKIAAAFDGRTQIFEWKHCRHDGTVFAAEVSLNAFFTAGKHGLQTIVRDITRRKQAEEERERLIANLEKALSEVKTLSGMLPICASCKKIRDDLGYWNQIEAFFQEHSDVEFSHGICPECTKKLYPGLI